MTQANAPVLNPADVSASMPNPVKQQLTSAVDRFTSRVDAQMNADAMSIARGKTPVHEGDQLSQAQLTELQSAATDFVKDIPIGAYSPQVAAAITDKLSAAGIDTRDVASMKLGDLGQLGGDIAKGLLKDLKADSPTAYYSLAGSLAAAVGYTAWNDGSAKLAKMGVKPEIKQSFFDDKLSVTLKGDWQSHFKNFNATATVAGKIDLSGGQTLSGSVTANSATGFDNARIDYSLNRDDLKLSSYATANRAGLESVGGSVVYTPSDSLRLSATVDHNFQTDRTTATAEAAWKVNNNVDLALSASHDSMGDNRVGFGARISF